MVVCVIVLAFSTVPELLAEEDSAGKHVDAALVELKESQDETSGKEGNLINETKLETAQDSGTHEQNNGEDETSSQESVSGLPEEDEYCQKGLFLKVCATLDESKRQDV